jgi:hypothetical protein
MALLGLVKNPPFSVSGGKFWLSGCVRWCRFSPARNWHQAVLKSSYYYFIKPPIPPPPFLRDTSWASFLSGNINNSQTPGKTQPQREKGCYWDGREPRTTKTARQPLRKLSGLSISGYPGNDILPKCAFWEIGVISVIALGLTSDSYENCIFHFRLFTSACSPRKSCPGVGLVDSNS